jgi:hypothetical protein
MFEQQMSQSIEAGAPDITYSGNEGPKSPQQEQQMMEQQMMEQQMMMQEQQMMAPVDYSSPAFKIKLIEQLMYDEGLDLGAATKKAEWIIRNKLKPRQGAAFGGIMGLDGRRQYGLGSKLKKTIRKIIPNEIADIAVKAAPFVAPFNPIAAGLMSGIGGFDQHGSISKGLKSGLMNYGMGQLARGIGGGASNLQGASLRTMPGQTGFGSYFSSPIQNSGGLGKLLQGTADKTFATSGGMDAYAGMGDPVSTGMNRVGVEAAQNIPKGFLGKTLDKVMQYVPTSLTDLKDPKKLLGAAGILTLGTKLLGGGPEETINTIMSRGEGYDMDDIRTRVTAAYKDPSGKLLADLRLEFPYLGTQASKNTAIMAYGGRIRRAEGGLMNLGGMEKDYRAEGGFVPIGAKEKADDVPARLSVNEFVFTADAVRSAGGGDIDKGAEVMERVMKNLEAGGQISEETQGMQGAREMFQTSQRLGEVI